MESSIIWLNGEFIDSARARISPFDDGLLTGHGIFETLVAYNGVPFAATRHHKRLSKAAKKLGLAIPGEKELENTMRKVIQANELASEAQVRVRVTVTKGHATSDKSCETLMVSASQFPDFPCAAAVHILPYTRNENAVLAGIKSTSYGENSVARSEVQAKGGNEGIFPNTKGNLCEGTCTNIFVIQADGQLITPPLSDGCLAGITRELVIEICHREKIPIKEVSMPIADLLKARGAFLSSSLRGIQPILRVDEVTLQLDLDGIVSRIQNAYRGL